MFQVLPAAVLFATVFSIVGFTRHSEITASKASGISFYRFILPIVYGSMCATVLGLLLAVAIPPSNNRRDELLQDKKSFNVDSRSNFTFSSEIGRVYVVGQAHVSQQSLQYLQIEKRKTPAHPGYVITATSAQYSRPTRSWTKSGWLLKDGAVQIMTSDSANYTVEFDSLRDRNFTEAPDHLLANPKAPDEMGFIDLGNFIKAMERSGSDVNKLRTERMLKIAIPVTCVIIMLFGAPLATSNQRGGAAYGVGVSLATTVIFLMLVQLTQAVGSKGIVNPELAAWLPSILFGVIGAALLAKVRT
jgi:lipopolysaccharide export system permease protein